MRKELYANPEKVTAEYMEKVKLDLGVTDPSQYFHMRDLARRNQGRFARMKGFLRVYTKIGDVLDHQNHGRTAVASALLCQAQKACLQMALDGGSWENAKLLWPETDIQSVTEFGGTETEMRMVHQYKKAVTEIKTRLKNPEAEPQDAGAGSDEGPKNDKKGRGRGRGRGGATDK
jgi:hypothetical protein